MTSKVWHRSDLKGLHAIRVGVDKDATLSMAGTGACLLVKIDYTQVAPSAPPLPLLLFSPDISGTPPFDGLRYWALPDFPAALPKVVTLEIHPPWTVSPSPLPDSAKWFDLVLTPPEAPVPITSLNTLQATAIAIDPDPGTGFPPRR